MFIDINLSGKAFPVVLAVILGGTSMVRSAPVRLFDQPPVEISKPADGVILVDFGRVAFGNLKFLPPADMTGPIRVHFGEAFSSGYGRINRKPPGTVRYATVEVKLDGKREIVVAPPADKRNTKQPEAILTPPAWGNVLPFRWVEIEGWSGDFKPANVVRQAGFLSSWNDAAASFQSSDETLNRIWDLCHYSIKASTFAGIYVDGDRERIPYEADAYLNQIGHYATDDDVQMARDTYDRLMAYPTWPSEWGPHMIFMAHADWLHTGDAAWLKPRYEALKGKLLLDRVGADGWVKSNSKQQGWNDLVDWPQTERDGFEFREVNTVVNAFHLAALAKMSDLARAVGKDSEAEDFTTRARKGREVFNQALFMSDKGAYRDGIGTDHASSHASLFPLAFGLVPEADTGAVAGYLAKRGMSCSVYAAQYLLEGLFRSGADKEALELIVAKGDRSWRHMLESGTTITWEAWDQKYKPNQDWNHAWGAAPANLLPRFVLGVEPLSPGWKTALIAPHPGGLGESKGRIPTPCGPIIVQWLRDPVFQLITRLPDSMTARIDLPSDNPADRVWIDGKEAAFTRTGSRLVLDQMVKGLTIITVKP